MAHLGDISKVNGAEIEPVDIITFGSPCQDLSTAGKRLGLKHAANGDKETTRSGLFMEAVRIIKEMREATNGKYPTFALWENVPGAFSSNRGEDYRIVLEELIKISEPGAVMPAVPKNGWPFADSYCGNGFSLAYRVFDAQYWPYTPQRRRRIYLVADFGGHRARKVLFEREGLREASTDIGTEWRRDPAGTQRSLGAGGAAIIAPTVPDTVREFIRAYNRVAPHQADNLQANDRAAYTLTTAGSDQTKTIICSDGRCTIRRLTPTEYARLQGFADRWGDIEPKEDFTDEEYRFWLEVRNTHAVINGRVPKEYTRKNLLNWYNKLHSETAEYKMWGNGIALPNALYCMQGMADALKEGENTA